MEPSLVSIDGQALSEALIDTNFDLVPDCQAVYFWRRNLVPPPHVVANANQFAQWIQKEVQIPYAKVNRKSLSHFLALPSFDVGGGVLTEEKIASLTLWLNSVKRRTWTKDFLAQLTELTPPLYVGEAGNLRARVRQHLQGQTDFARTLTEGLRLKWEDVILCYFRLAKAQEGGNEEDEHKNHRTLLELVAARLVVAGCTSRPG